jgi:hypothetical protein
MSNNDGGSGCSLADSAEQIAERRAGGFNLDEYLGRTPILPPLPDEFKKITILRFADDDTTDIAPIGLTPTSVRDLFAKMFHGGSSSRQVLHDWFREQTDCPDGNHFEVGMRHQHDDSKMIIFEADFREAKFVVDSIPIPPRIDYVLSAPITV